MRDYVQALARELQSIDDNQVKALRLAKTLIDSLTHQRVSPVIFLLIINALEDFSQRLLDRETTADGEPVQMDRRHWLMTTITSIPQLVPRVFLEIAILLPVLTFEGLDSQQMMLQRLLDMTHGIGDPLVALYAHVYLMYMSLRVSTSTGFIKPSQIFKHYVMQSTAFRTSTDFRIYCNTREISATDERLAFHALESPGVSWLVQCTCENATLVCIYDYKW